MTAVALAFLFSLLLLFTGRGGHDQRSGLVWAMMATGTCLALNGL